MSAELQSEQHIRKKMGAAGLAEPTILAFLSAARRVARGERGMLPEASLEPLKALPRLDEITEAGQENESLLDQLVVVKLNGGLGTSMGLDAPKSLLPVKEEETF